jgi:uncharacterized protein (TIGR02594 family)
MNRVMEIALGEYGTKGVPGLTHNPEVLTYFRAPGFKWVKDDETAWCAAFINWAFWKAGLKVPGTLAARSFLKVGKKTLAPKMGDLVVFWRISKDSPYGHVGFFIKATKDVVYVLGGNQSNAVNVSTFPLSQVLEYRTFSDKK